MRKIVIYCDRCRKEFNKWKNKRPEIYGISELLYDESNPYLDEPKDLCESCYDELERWWNKATKE